MRQWKVVALVLTFGLFASSLASAQSDNDQVRRELDQVKQQLRKVLDQNAQILRENAELRGRVDEVQSDDTLEQRINALADNLDYAAGTTVNSVANPITISGEFRARSGYTVDRDFGAFNGNAEDDEGTYTDARFNVAFEFDFDKDVTTHFELMANALYGNGNADPNAGDLDEINLYQGWILVRNIFGRKELSAKTGRQEIVLGNEYQFGNNDFFSGETFDGSHWMWESDNFTLHFIFAKLNVQNPFVNPADHPFPNAGSGDGYDDDELYSLYFTLTSIKNLEVDLYWIYFNGHNGGSFGTLANALGSSSTGDALKFAGGPDFFYHTFGIRLDGVFDVAAGLDYNVEFAYQTGNLSGSSVDVQGFSVEAELGITFNSNNNFRLYARFLFAEGADGNDTGYIPLFPERHAQATNLGGNDDRRARYGVLDIIPMDNVLTLQAGLTFDPAADWTLGLTGLWAQHDEDVVTPSGSSDDIGFEIDLFGEYRYSAQTTFSAGIAAFFPDDAAPLKGGGFAGNNDDVTVLFYLQTRVVF